MKKIASKLLLVVMMLSLVMSTCILASAEEAQPAKTTKTEVFGFADNTVPNVVGPYLMKYTPETRNLYSYISTIPTALGDIETSAVGLYCDWNTDFFKSHQNLYAFFPPVTDNVSSITLTMPEGVKALTFGLISGAIVNADIKAVTDNGTEFVQKYDKDNNVSTGFAFYSTDSDIKTITITLTQEGNDGFAIGDILVNNYDLRKDFKAITKDYTGSDLSKDAISSIDQKAFALKVLEQYGILKDMKLTQNGTAVTEAKDNGSYDLEVTVDNINQEFAEDFFNALPDDKTENDVLSILKDFIASEGYNDKVISTSKFTVKNFLTVTGQPAEIPEEETPLAPAENPKTGAQSAAVALMLVAAASATAAVVLKKKSK